MDELALKLKMDPVQLRLLNGTTHDEEKNIPFSSRHLEECLTTGADKFGWSARRSGVGSMKRGSGAIGVKGGAQSIPMGDVLRAARVQAVSVGGDRRARCPRKNPNCRRIRSARSLPKSPDSPRLRG
jgi:xanthine dehydrogenase YagR molybdenum-binding subunit